ncbi:hypothetical protein NL108_010287 [Boleophthalmus pectinirostris]|uniref:uncharacterized protein LOC110155004 n=1 Tax=Boleophthalmus pectinirostris TaxID=150288 RepID=UPI000A1C7698|nr:uncharacterized protein LOC110155004 [Boleophthalmus pectinirostris]KAJ0062984.1 hypothetical protein NL108_010287 [Boleophthalmus pectinirostris]
MARAVFFYTLITLSNLIVESNSHRLVVFSTGLVKSQHGYHFEQLTVYDGVAVSFCNGATKKEQLKPKLQTSLIPDNCEIAHYNILEAVYNIESHALAVDVVQRRRGCSRSSNGSVSAFEAWAVNGNDFITFDPDTLKWTPQSPSAFKIKELWDNQQTRNHAFSTFLKNECPKMIEQTALKSTPKNTELHIFAKPVEDNNEAYLICHVTTTDPSVKSVHLTGDGAPHVSGYSVFGPLPSDGDEWVLRLTARISLRLTHLTYGCAVKSEGNNVSVYWNGNTLDGRHIYKTFWDKSLIVIFGFSATIVFVLVISCIITILLKMIKMRRPPPPPPRPELREQLNSFIESSTFYPDIRNVLLAFIYGSNLPDRYQDDYNQWLEMMELQNNHDPEFYPAYKKPDSYFASTN